MELEYLDKYGHEELKSILCKMIFKRNTSTMVVERQWYNREISCFLKAVSELKTSTRRQLKDLNRRVDTDLPDVDLIHNKYLSYISSQLEPYDYTNVNTKIVNFKHVLFVIACDYVASDMDLFDRLSGLKRNVTATKYFNENLTRYEIEALETIYKLSEDMED